MNVPPVPDPSAGGDAEGATSPVRVQPPARLLPSPRYSGPIPWVIAILIALVVIAAAGGLAMRNLSNAASSSLSSALSVQVIEPNPDLREARGAEAAKILAGIEGVSSVRIKPEADPRKGTITIRYTTLDQLDLLCQRLTGGEI